MAERTVLAGLLKFYFNLESAYYDLMDALDHYFPVYSIFVNPLEDNSVPSFPVFAVIVLAIVGGLFAFAFTTSSANVPFSVLVRAPDGTLLSGVSVTILDTSTGKELAKGTTDAGRFFASIPRKSDTVLRLEKPGYETVSRQLGSLTYATGEFGFTLSPTAEMQEQLAQQDQSAQQLEQDVRDLAAQGYPEFQEALQEIRTGGTG